MRGADDVIAENCPNHTCSKAKSFGTNICSASRLDSLQDLFRVNLHLTFTVNNLTADGIPPKHLYLRVSRPKFG
jgi:hypothetical protein